MADNTIKINIVASNQAVAPLQQVDKAVDHLGQTASGFGKIFGATFASGLLVQWGQRAVSEITRVGASFVQAASAADDLRDALAQTSGAKAADELSALRQAVLTLPVSLEAATGALIKLRTSGINPSMADLQALAKTAGDLRGDASSNLERIAGLLGNIAQRGTLGAEDWNRQLMQFKELGLDVLPILQRELRLTDSQLANLGTSGVSAADIISSIMSSLRSGVTSDYGGWGDMLQEMTNQWNEFKLQVMNSGPFEAMKTGLSSFLDYLNSEKGRMDLSVWARETASAIITAFDLAIQAVYQLGNAVRGLQAIGLSFKWATAQEPTTVKNNLDEMLKRKKELDTIIEQPRNTKTEAGLFAFQRGQPDPTPGRADQINQAQTELKRLTLEIRAAQEYLADPANQPNAYIDALGKLGDEALAAQERVKNLRDGLADIKASAFNSQGQSAAKVAAGNTLPRSTTIAGANLDDWMRRKQEDLAKELDVIVGKEMEAFYQDQIKAGEQAIGIRRQLSQEIIGITQGETAAKEAALQQELADLATFASQSQANADQVAAYRIAKETEIARDRFDQETALQEQLRQLDLRMSLPTAGRFAKLQSDIQSQYLQDSIDLAKRRQRGELTSDQERQARDKLNEMRDRGFRQIGKESGNNWSAGWAEGMRRWLDECKSGFEYFRGLAEDTAKAMSQGFSDFFFDAMTGKLKTLKEYLLSFLTSIERSIANMLGEMVTKKLITGVANMMVSGAANGAVWQGGFRAFASGGIATQPTLGLIGEGRYNEAIVPLPDGKRIPVDLRGAGSQQAPVVTVNILNQSGTAVKVSQQSIAWDQTNQRMVLTLVADAATRNRDGFGDQLRSAMEGAR